MNFYQDPAEKVLEKLNTSESGLTQEEAGQRLAQYGPNKLDEGKKITLLQRFFQQLCDPMIIILLVAAAISGVTAAYSGESFTDVFIILIVVLINAVLGVYQESKAEKAIAALKKLSAPHARVIRNSKPAEIASEDLVPGDILLLEAGDFVPADARLLEAVNLKAEESALTGESLSVEKNASARCPEAAPLGDRKNMVFSSSTITAGHGTCVVTSTGMETQVGRIAHMINQEDSPQTPLQQKLAQTGKYLGIGALIICLVIFLLGLMESVPPLEMFMISISLAVAAIPEGLPAVVTIVLAIGVRRLAANRAIIRKLPAVETLGSANVICSDKTGTLTQNRMTVTELCSPSGPAAFSSAEGQTMLSFAALCNNSTLSGGLDRPSAAGEPTEVALVLAAANSGKRKNLLELSFPRVREIPFDSGRKLMTTVHSLGGGRYRIITKGAPDVLLRRCEAYAVGLGASPLTAAKRAQIEGYNEDMAGRALRVLGVAYRDVERLPKNADEIETRLVFCGLLGMIDPPRPQAKAAVRECQQAGILPVMITGDHIVTARAIAKELGVPVKELGILRSKDRSLTGAQLDAMSQKELSRHIFEYTVFARVSPEHKVRIVKAFQSRGAVVAMTGDGINDAPALKAADIGCAMGVSGTDVAKGAADMILTDDNFSTIVAAVRQGRGIFENIKKTVHFLLSCNIGEIITVLAAFLMRLPTPLLAIQLLWVNLVTDSLPALALGVEPVDEDIMKKPPTDAKKSLFAGGMTYSIAIEGCFIGMISLLAFTIGRVFFDGAGAPAAGRTMAFAVLSCSQLIHAFNVRSEKSLFEIGIFGNLKMLYSFLVCLALQVSVISIPALSAVFKTVPLNMVQWLVVAGLALSPLFIVEIEKAWNHWKAKKGL